MHPRWGPVYNCNYKFLGQAGRYDIYVFSTAIMAVFGPGRRDYYWSTHPNEFKTFPEYEQIAAMVALHG